MILLANCAECTLSHSHHLLCCIGMIENSCTVPEFLSLRQIREEVRPNTPRLQCEFEGYALVLERAPRMFTSTWKLRCVLSSSKIVYKRALQHRIVVHSNCVIQKNIYAHRYLVFTLNSDMTFSLSMFRVPPSSHGALISVLFMTPDSSVVFAECQSSVCNMFFFLPDSGYSTFSYQCI
jgi:hypothetical protein